MLAIYSDRDQAFNQFLANKIKDDLLGLSFSFSKSIKVGGKDVDTHAVLRSVSAVGGVISFHGTTSGFSNYTLAKYMVFNLNRRFVLSTFMYYGTRVNREFMRHREFITNKRRI